MSDLPPFGRPDPDRLAGLVFELAAQLHVERSRRLALETALIRSGVLTAETLAAAGESPEFREAAGVALDRSMHKLLRVLMEIDDPRRPLRPDLPGTTGGKG